MILTLHKWPNFKHQVASVCFIRQSTDMAFLSPLIFGMAQKPKPLPLSLPSLVLRLHFMRLSSDSPVSIPAWSLHGPGKTRGWLLIILCQLPRWEGTGPRGWPSCSTTCRGSWEPGMLKHKIDPHNHPERWEFIPIWLMIKLRLGRLRYLPS